MCEVSLNAAPVTPDIPKNKQSNTVKKQTYDIVEQHSDSSALKSDQLLRKFDWLFFLKKF